MRKLALTAVLSLVSIQTTFAIGPPPPQDGQLGLAAQAYFIQRPEIIDLAPRHPLRSLGTCHTLVLLVDFDDKPADLGPEAIRLKLFGTGAPSMRTYFAENSYGRFTVTGDVYGWFRSHCDHAVIVNRDGVAGTQDDYGLDTSPAAVDTTICAFPMNIWGLVEHTVKLAAETVDLSRYDNDGPDGIPSSGDDDGYIDALMIVHSGPGAEVFANLPGGVSVNYIWSCQSDLESYEPTSNTIINGKRIGAFVIVPELGEIGVFAHEFCHLLGLPDLYDTMTGLPIIGPLCLMDEGAWNGPPNRLGSVPSHLCAPMKYFLGWLEPTAVCIECDGVESISQLRLEAASGSPDACRILSNPGGVDWTHLGGGRGEYFLLENRQPSVGYFDTFLAGSGLLIWRVDESRPSNNDPDGRLVEVIQADGEELDPSIQNAADPRRNVPGEPSDFWPGSLGKHEFTPLSDPPSEVASGRYSGVSVTNIVETSAHEIIADVSVGAPRKGSAYAFPNPYRLSSSTRVRIVFLPQPGPDKPHAGSFDVTIFDLEGNFVRRLDEGEEVDENGTAFWNGYDEAGRQVDPGLYFFRVRSSGQQAIGTIAVKP